MPFNMVAWGNVKGPTQFMLFLTLSNQ